MKLFVLTPIYATSTTKQGATPVVHYFTREWAKMGNVVTVFHLAPKYPAPLYWVGRTFQHQLNTFLGSLVPINKPFDEDFETEGVKVRRICIKKVIPHSLYSQKQLSYAEDCIVKECEANGVPDWFIGHWDNPQLEILNNLKKRFNKPICIVFHNNVFTLEKKYGKKTRTLLKNVDVIGFRSIAGRQNFIYKYGEPKQSFIAYSGVSAPFLKAGEESKHVVKGPIHNFASVGSLISRKYPVAIVTGLHKAFPKGDFCVTFIGDGAEKEAIIEEHRRLGGKGIVKFTGRIPREEIIRHLKLADVFIMISKDEIFGLVYLEAMALGLIPIGSKNEGIDGIIQDGYNGFLCNAGNSEELARVLKDMKNMPSEVLERISKNAKETAKEYSDESVAKKYLEELVR